MSTQLAFSFFFFPISVKKINKNRYATALSPHQIRMCNLHKDIRIVKSQVNRSICEKKILVLSDYPNT